MHLAQSFDAKQLRLLTDFAGTFVHIGLNLHVYGICLLFVSTKYYKLQCYTYLVHYPSQMLNILW